MQAVWCARFCRQSAHFSRFAAANANLSSRCYSSSSNAAAVAIDKNTLMELRKITGYSFSNCKKALEVYGTDLRAAEKWLHELAQKEGWEKAGKMANRSARQGLIGVLSYGKKAAIIELNCETDFVAQNQLFRSLAQEMTLGCFNFETTSSATSIPGSLATCQTIEIDSLINRPSTVDGNRSLGDALSFALGKLGEKIVLTRAARLICDNNNLSTTGYAHPRQHSSVQQSESSPSVLLGRFGVIAAFQCESAEQRKPQNFDAITTHICQHIVGMSPERVGEMPDREEIDRLREIRSAIEMHKDKKAKLEDEAARRDDDDAVGEEQQTRSAEAATVAEVEDESKKLLEKDEKELLRQAFLICPELTVAEFVQLNQISVIDFIRFQCGDS